MTDILTSKAHATQVYNILHAAWWNAYQARGATFDRSRFFADKADGIERPEPQYSPETTEAERIMRSILDKVKEEAIAKFGEDQGHPGCRSCLEFSVFGGPRHQASDRCQSGKRNHCSCGICW